MKFLQTVPKLRKVKGTFRSEYMNFSATHGIIRCILRLINNYFPWNQIPFSLENSDGKPPNSRDKRKWSISVWCCCTFCFVIFLTSEILNVSTSRFHLAFWVIYVNLSLIISDHNGVQENGVTVFGVQHVLHDFQMELFLFKDILCKAKYFIKMECTKPVHLKWWHDCSIWLKFTPGQWSCHYDLLRTYWNSTIIFETNLSLSNCMISMESLPKTCWIFQTIYT